MAIKTFNRGRLLKLARAGKLEQVGFRSFCDMMGESSGDEVLPVRVKASYNDFVYGCCNLDEGDFRCNGGRAYSNDDGTIALRIHSNLSHKLRVKS